MSASLRVEFISGAVHHVFSQRIKSVGKQFSEFFIARGNAIEVEGRGREQVTEMEAAGQDRNSQRKRRLLRGFVRREIECRRRGVEMDGGSSQPRADRFAKAGGGGMREPCPLGIP